jgi:hypothetical protein
MKSGRLLCPSYVAKPGALLYGVVNAEGQTGFLEEPIQINATFVLEASKGRTPEEQFRFARACIGKGCKKWNGAESACGLVGKIVENMNRKAEAVLLECGLRLTCQWFTQQGSIACASCPEIIRNVKIP